MRRTPASASGATRSVRPSRSRSDATAHQALRSAPSSGPASIRVTPAFIAGQPDHTPPDPGRNVHVAITDQIGGGHAERAEDRCLPERRERVACSSSRPPHSRPAAVRRLPTGRSTTTTMSSCSRRTTALSSNRSCTFRRRGPSQVARRPPGGPAGGAVSPLPPAAPRPRPPRRPARRYGLRQAGRRAGGGVGSVCRVGARRVSRSLDPRRSCEMEGASLPSAAHPEHGGTRRPSGSGLCSPFVRPIPRMPR